LIFSSHNAVPNFLQKRHIKFNNTLFHSVFGHLLVIVFSYR